MRKSIFKIATALLACFIAFGAIGFAGCGNEEEKKDYGANYRPETQVVDKSKLAGMMYILYEGQNFNNVDYKLGLKTMKNLGVKRIRFDVPASAMFPTLAVEEENNGKVEEARAMVKEAADNGIEFIGGFWSANYFADKNTWTWDDKFYRRDLTEGSDYRIWLDGVEQMAYKVVKALPGITLWEMGNEPNGTSFAYTDGTSSTLKETAEIYTDIMYAMSQAIHRANPDNITVMGGLTELAGLGTTGVNATFLNYIYDNIYSGNFPSKYADDYFQVACWHPYTFDYFDPDEFVAENDKVYNVIREREGKDKKVIFSEFGFSDASVSQSAIVKMMPKVFDTIKNRLPYVETFCWFRAFNDYNDKNWGGDTVLVSYGLFYDPNYEYEGDGNNRNKGTLYIPGEPKPQAYAYQAAAGGSGDLTLMVISREQILAKDSAKTVAELKNDELPLRYGKKDDGSLFGYSELVARGKTEYDRITTE